MKISLLEQRHPEHDAECLGELRALAEGGKAWRDRVAKWLPKNPSEPDDVWTDRKRRAVYHNYAGGILGLFGAYLFSEAPRIDLEDEYFAAFMADVDGAGAPLARWFRSRFRDALIGRRSFIWVNLPARAEGVAFSSKADELKGGALDAFAVGLAPEDVLDWGRDAQGALTWVLFRTVATERTDPTQPRVNVYTWTSIDTTTIRRWEWRATPDKQHPGADDDAKELPAIAHGIPRLPVVELVLPEELWAMELLRDPVLAHLRARNDLSWALNRTAHAMPVIKRQWGGPGDDLMIGAGYFIRLEREDTFEWTEPPGNSIVALREDCAELREEIFRVVHQMALAVDNDASRARASGESKQTDWQATKVVMSAYADVVRSAIRETIEIVGLVRGLGELDVTVQGLDGWQQLSLDEFLTGSAMATQAAKMSPTYRREVAKREAARLLPDLGDKTLQAIHDEIDGSPEEDRIGGAVDSGVEKAGAWTVVVDYKAGAVDRKAAANSLISLYSMTPENAEKMLGDADHKPPAPPAPPGGLPGAKPPGKPGAFPPKKPPIAAP